MATSVNLSRFFAALAAVLTFALAACGGGEKEVASQESVTRQVLSGPVASEKGPSVSFAVESSGAAIMVKTAQAVVAPVEYTNSALLNWAQGAYPELFPGTPLVFDDVVAPDGNHYYARYYAATQNYVGVCLGGGANTCTVGGAYGLGPYTGNVLAYFGHKDAYKCLVNAEWCRPLVTSVTPADGATNVSTQNVAITVNFDRQLICPSGPVSGTFGAIIGTMTCTNLASAASVTIVATTLPDNSRITASLSGFRSAEGSIEMAAYTWSFVTKKNTNVTTTKVLTVNLGGSESGAVSIIDPSSTQVAQVTFPKSQVYILPQKIYVDSTRDVAYVGMGAGLSLNRFNPRTGAVLSPFRIEPEDLSLKLGHGVLGIAGTASEVCIVTGFGGAQSQYRWYNRLICFNPDIGDRVFMSEIGFLGSRSEIPTHLLYSGAHDKYYVLMAEESCLIGDPAAGGLRDGYCQGSVGRAIEIDAKTKQKTGRTWSVGSMPLDGMIVGDKLYVLKSGDSGATIIDLATGTAQSVDWTHLFGNGAYPVDIQPDVARGVYYVSDWLRSVRVMSFATNQQVGEILLPNAATPRGLTMAAGSLWVVSPYSNVAPGTIQGSTRVHRIDPVTRTVVQSLEAGPGPWDIAAFER